MDFNREWTQFALDAEVAWFGTARICKAHNKAVKEAVQKARRYETAPNELTPNGSSSPAEIIGGENEIPLSTLRPSV